MASNLEIIQGTYDAFAEGDLGAVLATFDDEITWVEAAGGPYGGVYHGPDQVVGIDDNSFVWNDATAYHDTDGDGLTDCLSSAQDIAGSGVTGVR